MNYWKEKLRKPSHLQLHPKIPRSRFNQRSKDLYLEYYKALKKETEEHINEWKHILCS